MCIVPRSLTVPFCRTMSDRPIVLVPGPVEMSDEVLQAAATIGTSGVDPSFAKVFGSALHNVKKAFLALDGIPFVVAGSGSLGWDMFGANVLEDGDEVLVISHGYFGDQFAEYLVNQGAKVTTLVASQPGSFPMAELSKLDLRRFKAATVTHVDTSTAVVAPVQQVAALLRAANPNIVICVDSVAGLGGETLRTTDWDVDFVMTGSQKALAVPPGLSICVARPRAIAAAKSRKTPVRFTYVSWAKWTPIMESFMQDKPAYFATPPVGLVVALDVGLKAHLANGGSEARFREHAAQAAAFRAALAELGLRTVASEPQLCAATLTAVYYPEGVNGDSFRGAIRKHGVVVAGGLHKQIGSKYFRVGHMGYSVYGGRVEHLLRAVNAIEKSLVDHGCKVTPGVAAAVYEAHVKKAAL